MIRKMETKILIVLLILLTAIILVNPVSALADDNITRYESLVINITVRGEVQGEKITAILQLFPIEDKRQKILELNTFGKGAEIKKEKANITYEWEDAGKAEFGFSASIKTDAILDKIKEISFPIEISEYEEYRKESENIDITDEIIKKANEIVAGKTDFFSALFTLAEFVNTNLTYDKSYANVTKKASWILAEKKGVCDEYTILFIALCRALNIPAKYIGGTAYSNLEKVFGSHAWAEVYFPSYGWVPFDVTYGQYGWIDATHIALQKTADSEVAVGYVYIGSIKTEKLSIDTAILEKKKELEKKTEIKISPLKKEVKEKSFIPLQVEIENLQDFYLPLTLYLTRAPGVYGSNVKHILLKPKAKKTEFFILEIPEAEEGYVYEATITLESSFNNLAEEKIKFSTNFEFFSLEKAKKILEQIEEEQYLYEVLLECAGRERYEDEGLNITCKIKSKANFFLQDLRLCIKNKCESFDLPIGTKKEIIFLFESNEIVNETDFIATISNKDKSIKKSIFFTVEFLFRPDLKIISLGPAALDYTNNKVNLLLETKSICKNLTIEINKINFEDESLDGKEFFTIDFPGKYALTKKVKVKAECYDLRNRRYKDEKSFEVTITGMPWHAKIKQALVLFFSRLFG